VPLKASNPTVAYSTSGGISQWNEVATAAQCGTGQPGVKPTVNSIFWWLGSVNWKCLKL